MSRKLLFSDCEGKEFYVEAGDFYRSEVLTPLEERVAQENPEMAEGFEQLKAFIGEADFARYISPLISIKKNDGLLLVITGQASHRIILMERYYLQLKKAFQTEQVKVVINSGR